jgi:hypothetical protein
VEVLSEKCESENIPYLLLYHGNVLAISLLGEHYHFTVDVLDSVEDGAYDESHAWELERRELICNWFDWEVENWLKVFGLDSTIWKECSTNPSQVINKVLELDEKQDKELIIELWKSYESSDPVANLLRVYLEMANHYGLDGYYFQGEYLSTSVSWFFDKSKTTPEQAKEFESMFWKLLFGETSCPINVSELPFQQLDFLAA